MEEITFVQIPVGVHYDDGVCVLFNTKETDKIVGNIGIVVQEDTLEEAKEQFLDLFKSHIKWQEERSQELDLWKPFQKGDWKSEGGAGKWFTIFGINVYFRYGEGMKGGRYIPFTKLNIRIINYWYTRKIRK